MDNITKFTNVNSIEFISRLRIIIDYYNLSSSTFADAIEVQRSSISHLMSGRNKPSLDFVMKVVDKFPEVDLYWLLNGNGNFPKTKKEEELKKTITKKTAEKPSHKTPSLFAQNEPMDTQVSNTRFSANGKKLIKVVLLYDDGTFEEFNK